MHKIALGLINKPNNISRNKESGDKISYKDNKCLYITNNREDTVSFTSNPSANNEDFSLKVFKKRVEKKLGNRKQVFSVLTHNNQGLPKFVYFYPGLSAFALKMDKINSNYSAEISLKQIDKLLDINEKLGSKMQEILIKSASKLGIKKEFIPQIMLYYDESSYMGGYGLFTHAIHLNTYWLEDAEDPEALLSLILSHELSHTKDLLSFSLIQPDDWPQSCFKSEEQKRFFNMIMNNPAFQKYREQVMQNNPVDRNYPEYKRINNLLINYLKVLENNLNNEKDRIEYAEIFNQIGKICNLNIKEISTLKFNSLCKGIVKVNRENGAYAAVFSQEKLNNIESIVKEKLPEIMSVIQQNKSETDKLYSDFSDYYSDMSEILARYNSSKITAENIKDGIIQDTYAARIISNQYINLEDKLQKKNI